MADRVSRKNGRHELAYSGEVPWHGFGTDVGGLQTAPAILEKAGLLWTVSARPLYFTAQGAPVNPEALEANGLKSAGDARVIVRDDLDIPLGVVSTKYVPIQNSQAGEVLDAVLEAGEGSCEVAGALDDGQRCWIVARVPGEYEVVPGDAFRPYVLIAWGHDGKNGLALKRTKVRVVCHNTITQAIGSKWSRTADVHIKHNASAKIRIEEARSALGLIRKQTEQDVEAYRALAARQIGVLEQDAIFAAAFPSPVNPGFVEDEQEAYRAKLERWTAVQSQILKLYQSGKGTEIPGVAGTAWAAVNAVSEYVDHVYPVRDDGTVSTIRQESAIFGSYADAKTRAMASALALVG